MRSRKIEQFEEKEIEFSGVCRPGHPAKGPSFSCAGGEPGEPAHVEDLYVGVIIKGVSIDITEKLNRKQRDYFEELLIEAACEAEEEREER